MNPADATPTAHRTPYVYVQAPRCPPKPLTSTVADVPGWFEALAAKIAPHDLGGIPLYVGLTSRLPAGFAGEMSGYTSPWLWLALAEVLGDRGAGAGIVLDDLRAVDEIRQILPGLSREKLSRFAVGRLVHTAVHELAHVLEMDQPYDTPPTRLRSTAARCFRESLAAHHAQERRRVAQQGGGPIRPDLSDHGADFTRIALHIIARAERLGVCLIANDICAGSRYEMFDAERYRLHLWQELQWMATASFAQIRARPNPLSPFSENQSNASADFAACET